jgi:hypothetical protein
VDTGSRLGFNDGDLEVLDPCNFAGDGSTVVVCFKDRNCDVVMHQGRGLIPGGAALVDIAEASIIGVAVLMQRELNP